MLFLLAGLGLLAYLVRRVGVAALWEYTRHLRWTFLALIALFGGVHFLRALSWRLCLREDGHRVSLPAVLNVWLAGEAVSYLFFGWSGEAFRAAAIREAIPVERTLSALVVSRVFYMYASLVLTFLSFLLSQFLLPLPEPTRALIAAATLISGAAALAPLAGRSLFSLALKPLQAAVAPRRHRRVWDRLHVFVATLERDLAAAFSQKAGTFARLLGLNLLASLAGVFEVYLILRALGVAVTLPAALLIEAIAKVVSIFTYFVPGSVGVREGGMVLGLQLLHMSAALAMTLVLVRRARALVWVGMGGLLLTLNGLRPLVRARAPARPRPHNEAA